MDREPEGTAAGRQHDPAPQPPVEPALEDCCGNGCTPCIFDLYEDACERYRANLEAWRARQHATPAGGPPGSAG